MEVSEGRNEEALTRPRHLEQGAIRRMQLSRVGTRPPLLDHLLPLWPHNGVRNCFGNSAPSRRYRLTEAVSWQ